MEGPGYRKMIFMNKIGDFIWLEIDFRPLLATLETLKNALKPNVPENDHDLTFKQFYMIKEFFSKQMKIKEFFVCKK